MPKPRVSISKVVKPKLPPAPGSKAKSSATAMSALRAKTGAAREANFAAKLGKATPSARARTVASPKASFKRPLYEGGPVGGPKRSKAIVAAGAKEISRVAKARVKANQPLFNNWTTSRGKGKQLAPGELKLASKPGPLGGNTGPFDGLVKTLGENLDTVMGKKRSAVSSAMDPFNRKKGK